MARQLPDLLKLGKENDFVELVGSSTAVNTFEGNDNVILYDTDVLLQLGAGTDVVEIHNSWGNFDGGSGVDTAKFFPIEIDDFEINLQLVHLGVAVNQRTWAI